MKITKRDILVVLYIASVIAIYLVYQFVFTPKLEETDLINEENGGLRAQVQELEQKKDSQEKIEGEIEDMKKEINVIADDYPDAITEEDIILYVSELNREIGVNATGVSFTKPATLYFVVGEEKASQYNMMLQEIQVTVDYTTDYEGFKKIVNYINEDTEHREISSVNINISEIETKENDENAEETKPSKKDDEELEETTESLQQIKGNFTLVLYYIDGKLTDNPDKRYENDDINHGVNNVFG